MGVPWEDAAQVGALLGIKTVLNEFLAYLELSALMEAGALQPRSAMIASRASSLLAYTSRACHWESLHKGMTENVVKLDA